jgi:hypothetical protein
MRFICLGYTDEQEWNALTKSERDAIMNVCFDYDDDLARRGHAWVGGGALRASPTAKTLRWRNGKVVVTDGPYAETKEQLGGFGVLEARDIDEAIELMRPHPAVRVSCFEIRPADETANGTCTAPATPDASKFPRTFYCLGYMDEKKWETMAVADQEAFMKDCTAYDEMLRKNGHWVAAEALQYARQAKTLRFKDGKVLVTDGPFAETKEQLGGVVAVQAWDLQQAVELFSKHPALPFGITIELRPMDEEMTKLSEARLAAKST